MILENQGWGATKHYCNLINNAAKTYGLDPRLIAAVIQQESGGDPNAYSSSGAVGLMQIMPCDGIAASFICDNKPCFKNRPTIEELKNPEFNVEFGTRMLAGLISKHGSAREALYRYGPYDVGYYYADIIIDLYNGLKS